jgi:hypothetical protein
MRLAPAAAKRDDGEGRQERRADIPVLVGKERQTQEPTPQSGIGHYKTEREAPASPTRSG